MHALQPDKKEYLNFTIPSFKLIHQDQASQAENNDADEKIRYVGQEIEFDEDYSLMVQIPVRKTSDYLEWDPERVTQQFKLKVYQIKKFVEQKYGLKVPFSHYLDYFKICKMNESIFLKTIYNNLSPWLEY